MLKSGTSNRNGTGPYAPDETRARDLTMRVAFQGDRGAYAESAIAQIWRHPVEQIPGSHIHWCGARRSGR